MKESVYIWEITIPQKIEYKLWQALLLMGIDIHDEYKVWFADYMRINKASCNGLYADVLITGTDSEITQLIHELNKLKVFATDIWLVDEVCEEEEAT